MRVWQQNKALAFVLRHKIKLSVLFVLFAVYWCWLPAQLFDTRSSTVLTDDSGQLLSARIAPDGQWRFPDSDSVPFKFETAILAFEDEYFYYHPGFNPASIFKSVKRNLHAGKIQSGGSTLTMQLARMVRHNQPRTYYNKIVELLLAVRVELSYKKRSILNLYSSHAPFGSNVVGLSAAAWRYFGRAPEKLSWAESALLAVLPNSPSLIYPGKNQEKLKEKRDRLLKKLFVKKYIDEGTYNLSLLEPLPEKAYSIPQIAPHLLSQSMKEHGPSKHFHSTINKNLQLRVDDLLNKHVQNLFGNQVNNACALVAETATGKVIAYVGNSSSPNNEHDNFVDIIRSPRSTGSILKPFLYAFMLSENKILPASLLEDIPTQIGAYGPKNFHQTYDGLVPANQAIARSLNVPAIKMLQDYGNIRFYQRLKQLGFTTFNKPASHYGLSIILGGGEATLWDISSAYASMGRSLSGYSIIRDKYPSNTYHPLYYLNDQKPKKGSLQKGSLITASALYYTFNAMTELLRPQDYVGWMQFLSKNRIAWKTGTSFGFRDAWAVGLNEKYTVAVWVGNADGEGRPGLTGTAMAAPLMFSIFNQLSQPAWFTVPTSDLEKIEICKESGFKASDICNKKETKYYPKGAAKTKTCPFHKLIHLDETGQYRVNSNCYPVDKMKHQSWFVASPTQEYFYRQHSFNYKPLPDYLASCAGENNFRQIDIIYPREGFKIYVPVDQSGNKSRCIFKAAHKNANATIYWYLDGDYLGSTEKFHQYSVLPSVGKHRLELTDNTGESLRCDFDVIGK